jgi:hypothetical protein
MKRLTVLSLALLTAFGCGDPDDPDCICPPEFEEFCECSTPTPTPTPEPTITPTPTPTATPEPDPINPPPPTNPKCKAKPMRATNGFLWKPQSENTGDLVVLLPNKFQKPFDTVTAERKDGKRDRGRFNGFANGNRQHWFFPRPGGKYKNNSNVIAKETGNVCTWKIGKSNQRNE